MTGRRLPDLRAVFAELSLFDLVVAENGALLHSPTSGQTQLLTLPPPPKLTLELVRHDVRSLECGEVIVATVTPYDQVAQTVIRELGLDWRVIMNRNSVMLLPAGVDKASGLAAALRTLNLHPSDVLAIGDAENDLPLLAAVTGARVAVANAIVALKNAADFVTASPEGAGVVESIRTILGENGGATGLPSLPGRDRSARDALMLSNR